MQSAPLEQPADTAADGSAIVENVAASRAGLRLHTSATPDPTLMRSVTDAKAAIGTVDSRTSRLSACHTASNPFDSAYRAKSMPSRIVWASWR